MQNYYTEFCIFRLLKVFRLTEKILNFTHFFQKLSLVLGFSNYFFVDKKNVVTAGNGQTGPLTPPSPKVAKTPFFCYYFFFSGTIL